MDAQSYKEIEKLLDAARGTHGTITVSTDSLRNIFRELRHYHRQVGILGYDEQHRPIVNDIGMIPIIRSVFEEDCGALGAFDNFEVIAKVPGQWDARATFQTKHGPTTLVRTYALYRLEERRPNFNYQFS